MGWLLLYLQGVGGELWKWGGDGCGFGRYNKIGYSCHFSTQCWAAKAVEKCGVGMYTLLRGYQYPRSVYRYTCTIDTLGSVQMLLHSGRRLLRFHSTNRARLRSSRCWHPRRCRCSRETLFLTHKHRRLLPHLQKPSRHTSRGRHTQKALSAHTLQRLRTPSHIASQIPGPHKTAADHASQHAKRPRVSVRNTRLRVSVSCHRIRDGAEVLSRTDRRVVQFARFLRFCGAAGEHVADEECSVLLVPIEQSAAELYKGRAVFVFEQGCGGTRS